jgi:hypothetical protein
MIHEREYYEGQSALAAAGQLTDAERNDLEQHAATCPACRECMAEMAALSRELFMVQAARIKPSAARAGMQQRFLARAAAAGIPLNRPTPASLYPRTLRAAATAILLAMSLSLTWRAFPAHGSDANASPGTLTAQSKLEPAFDHSIAYAAETRTLQHASVDKSQSRVKSASVQHGGSDSSAHSTGEPHHSYFDLDQPLFATQASLRSSVSGNPFSPARRAENPLTAGLLASVRASLPGANGASCFGIAEDGKPEEQACHLEIKLASLSSLEPVERPEAVPGLTTLKLSAPLFHISHIPVQ